MDAVHMGEAPASVTDQPDINPVPTDDLPVVSDPPVMTPAADAVSPVPETAISSITEFSFTSFD